MCCKSTFHLSLHLDSAARGMGESGVSLSETFLDGSIGEEATELLDDPCVYLAAEGDVEEKKPRTRLKELLQRGGTHQSCSCQLDEARGTQGT